MVNESGAAIYSASEVAREEFPDQDITVRGAVRIGRRLMDPLAELGEARPQEHWRRPVPARRRPGLAQEIAGRRRHFGVNAVGVEVNTASKQLLTYVSGLNATIAENIVELRNRTGAFKARGATCSKSRASARRRSSRPPGSSTTGGQPAGRSAVHPETLRHRGPDGQGPGRDRQGT